MTFEQITADLNAATARLAELRTSLHRARVAIDTDMANRASRETILNSRRLIQEYEDLIKDQEFEVDRLRTLRANIDSAAAVRIQQGEDSESAYKNATADYQAKRVWFNILKWGGILTGIVLLVWGLIKLRKVVKQAKR